MDIKWGMIGCGDVTEVKSGPAFSKVAHSSLAAVMRRDEAKAKDYAERHHVPRWYNDADKLLQDPGINAIYVATPPSTHEPYTIAALNAGKNVYVEKPMALNAAEAQRMQAHADSLNLKLAVAHYRREQPIFKKIRHLLSEKLIGDVRFVTLEFLKPPPSPEELAIPKNKWRVDPRVAGGGLFHDLAPHQLDLLYYYFGDPLKVWGTASNQSKLYHADDMVTGNIVFRDDVHFTGTWCFNVNKSDEKDVCRITGSRGNISFSVFGPPRIEINIEGRKENIQFEPLQHVQQPMIEKVVEYFRGIGPNPCSGSSGVKVMEMMDEMTGKIIHKAKL